MGGRRLPGLELDAAERAENREVAARLAIDKDTVDKWRRRFIAHGSTAARCASLRCATARSRMRASMRFSSRR